LVSVTTTASRIIQVSKSTSFVLHADATNTAIIQVSGTDRSAKNDFDELMAGQDLSFTGYVGEIWAVAATGTQLLYIPFRQDETGGTTLKGP
jgi:hypothetical protein